MTYFFSDENANRIAERQWAFPATPEVGDPGVLQGAGMAAATALPASIGQMFQTTMDWGPARGINALASFADDWVGTGFAENYDKQRELLRQSIRSLKPDPATTGAAGQIIYGAGTVIPQAALGFAAAGPVGAAAVAGTAQANTEYANQTEQGVDAGTAAAAAAITGVTTAIGVAIPGVMGTGLMRQLGYSVGTNVALGGVQRGSTAAVLEAGGYKTMADNYRVLDGMAIATDAVLGAAVPFVGRLGKRGENTTPRPEPKPSEVDAAHYANEVVHLERDTAPGLHKTPESANAHIEATIRAQEQLFAEGRTPENLSVADLAARTDVEADPRHIQDVLTLAEQVRTAAPAELRKEVERIVRLEEQPPAPVAVKAPEPIPEFPKPAEPVVVKTQQVEDAAPERGVEPREARTPADANEPGRPIPDQLADRMFEQVKTGEDTSVSPITQVGESVYQRGGFSDPRQFRQFVQEMATVRDQGLTGRAYQDAVAEVAAKYEPAARAADPKFYDDNAALAQAGDVPAAELAVARQAIANMPDMTIVDENGNSVSAKEYLDGIDREIDNAKKDAKLHDVAVACFMLHGDN